MFTVYVLYNKKHNKTYTGFTSNLESRIKQHNEGNFPSYTSRFDGQWILIHSENFRTESEARKREKSLKSYQGRKNIRNIPV